MQHLGAGPLFRNSARISNSNKKKWGKENQGHITVTSKSVEP
jgi:hypothetical protein